MISNIQAVVLGLLQGITELFPISSLGHSVLLPSLLGWNIDQSSETFVVFLVFAHLATALVLIGFFWKEWVNIVKGIFRSLAKKRISDDPWAKLGWLIIVGTIPAGLVGLLFQTKIEALFASATLVALVLILNGLLLYTAEIFRKKSETAKDMTSFTFWKALKIGCAQCLALIPGFSRTGSTLGAGLMTGLTHEDAAHYSFLLATPIIFAAGALKLPTLLHISFTGNAMPILLGTISSALAAYLSVKFLVKYFKTKTLTPFAIYCILAGLFSLLVLAR
ncbi:MAG TPA: undecaprenyl-diphosphate phosphatase [Candidatus Paceibacterota bacterium]|nr:undecaprenyl-diphosphate phosphatase [Candidatus Paceibacterota bacterium]